MALISEERILTPAETRRDRIQRMMDKIKRLNKDYQDVVKEKLIAEMCLKYNTARRTVLEYINPYISAGIIKEEKNKDGDTVLFWNWDRERQVNAEQTLP